MKNRLSSFFILSVMLFSLPVRAHDMSSMDMEEDQEMQMQGPMMTSNTSANIPMQRKGSGTSWLTDSSPMYAYYFQTPSWSFMLHGNAHIRYNTQNPFNQGKRGGSKFDVPNWLMFMGQTPVFEKDKFTFSTMLSLDLLTVGNSGYPLLFQTGESYQGKPLIDAQHPHDLFSEISATYAHTFNENTSAFAYLGFPGEPAIGPTAFMHRISAFSNPDAPLSHHWQDSTHIVFGVFTLGAVYKDLKIDGSLFTGREPDENRYNFDMPKFDSYSGRITYNPIKDISLQTSYAYLKSPEALEPDVNVHRVTASVFHNKLFNDADESYTNLASTLNWGMNLSNHSHSGSPTPENSVLLESELQLLRKNFIYGKFEYVQKAPQELNITNSTSSFNVSALTVGASRTLVSYKNLMLNLGAQTTLYFSDEKLNNEYGKNPFAFEVYLKLSPDLMNMSHHKHNMQDMPESKDHEQEHHEHSEDKKADDGSADHSGHDMPMDDDMDMDSPHL